MLTRLSRRDKKMMRDGCDNSEGWMQGQGLGSYAWSEYCDENRVRFTDVC